MPFYLKEREIAVPGECIAEGAYIAGHYTYKENNKIYAAKLGLVSIEGLTIRIIPLTGKYLPKKGDVIIGEVIDLFPNGWLIDTNSAYPAMLNIKDAVSEYIPRGFDLTQYFSFGDYIVCKIINVSPTKLIDVSMKGPGLRKLKGGRIKKVNPHKVPRIIGKRGSMIDMIKEATACKIIVGQNGVIWILGEDPRMELAAVKAIRMIEEKSQVSGLTELVKKFLEKETMKRLPRS